MVPEELVNEILTLMHHDKTAGHLGTEKLTGKIRARFYWPGRQRAIKQWCKTCEACAAYKVRGPSSRAPMTGAVTGCPFERITVNLMGPFPTTERGNMYIMVVTDYFSRLAESYAIPNQQAVTVAKKLVEMFMLRLGVPRTIHSDQGKYFESRLFQEMCKLLQMNKTRTTPYNPQSDGLVERMNKTLISMLSVFVEDNQSNWDELLPYVMMTCRSSVQSSTGFTPYKMLFGAEITLPVDVVMGTHK